MTDLPPPPPITTQEIRIVDAQGNPRILLSAKDGVPVILLMQENGDNGARVMLDTAGRPAVSLDNPISGGPSATMEIDDKGAHVKFDRPGGASSYLFLNNAGGSGMVLIDPEGRRRLEATVASDGTSTIKQLGADGKPLP